MKKSIYVLFILLLVGFFFWGCSSTPEAVPEEEIVTVVPDAGESETVPSGDAFSDVNEKYLSAAAAARDSAIVAGADVLVPDIFTEIDAMYQQLCQVCADNPGQSQETALIDVADRFTALERLVLAQNLRNKIGDLKFDNIDPQALADGDAAGEEAILLFESGGSGSDIRAAADKAFNAYNSIVLAGFKSLAEAKLTRRKMLQTALNQQLRIKMPILLQYWFYPQRMLHLYPVITRPHIQDLLKQLFHSKKYMSGLQKNERQQRLLLPGQNKKLIQQLFLPQKQMK